MIAETSGDAVVYKYVRSAGLLYAENATDEKTWYVKDAHGDTVQLTDGNGNIVWNYAYDAFGNQKETVNSGTEPYNPFRYTGEYFDAETGFIYLRARYMDPQTGRFISEDPACDGANWYVYAGGNPVMLFDPSGLVVTAWDREHLTTYEQGLLSAYTNDWNNAYASGDEAGMNQASLAAESLRAKYRTNNEITLDNGVTISFENQNRSNEPINKPMEFFEQSRQEIELASGLKITGTPNSRAVLKNPDGSIKQIRYYDSDGNAKIDIDFNHPGDNIFPHKHTWKDGERSKDHEPLDPNEKKTENRDVTWAVIGAVIYIIVSEGSRIIFPPRNLVPVP